MIDISPLTRVYTHRENGESRENAGNLQGISNEHREFCAFAVAVLSGGQRRTNQSQFFKISNFSVIFRPIFHRFFPYVNRNAGKKQGKCRESES